MNEYSKALLGLVIPLYSKYGIAFRGTPTEFCCNL